MEPQHDDFANDKEIQRQRKARKEHDLMIGECVSLLKRQFSVEPGSCTDIESFLLFKSFESASIIESFQTVSGDLPIEVYQIEYHWSIRLGRGGSSGHDQCFLGLLTLKKGYPPTYIYKETFRTIITDWFIKQDVDFDDQKKFSKSFHVITADKDKLKIMLINKQLDRLAEFPDLEIELNGNHCLFKVSDKPMSPEDVKKFIDLSFKLLKIFS
jgi:hypothetical protein